MKIYMSGANYKIGTYKGECPYKLKDIIAEIKKVDKLNIASELYEYNCEKLAEKSWEINMKVLQVLDMLYAWKEELDCFDNIEEIKEYGSYFSVRHMVEEALIPIKDNYELNKMLRDEMNSPEQVLTREFNEKFFSEISSVMHDLTEEEFTAKLDELFASDDRYTLDLIKEDVYWGLFDSICTPRLPQEFVDKFKKGYKGDNKELLYKLCYLDYNFSHFMVNDVETAKRLINECIALDE